jgi:crossover junction endodeoxyribonuclease RusA
VTRLVLPFPPKELNPNKKLHWAQKAKYAKAYREACYVLTKQHMAAGNWLDLPSEGDLHFWLDFYPPDKRHRDDDNLIRAFKSGRDGVADALGVNDRRFRIHPYLQTTIGGMVKVEITEGPSILEKV